MVGPHVANVVLILTREKSQRGLRSGQSFGDFYSLKDKLHRNLDWESTFNCRADPKQLQ